MTQQAVKRSLELFPAGGENAGDDLVCHKRGHIGLDADPLNSVAVTGQICIPKNSP